MDKLKACPFCGSDDVALWITGVEYTESYTISCSKCSGTIIGDGKIEAIETWNNRAELEEYKQNILRAINAIYFMGENGADYIYKKPLIELIESGELE